MHGSCAFHGSSASGCGGDCRWPVVPPGGRAVWRQCIERDPLVAVEAAAGRARRRSWAVIAGPGRIEAEAAFILSLIAATPDMTLAELAEKLRRERGLSVGLGTIWRFFDRRGITFKNVWPAPLASRLSWALVGRAQGIRHSGSVAVAMMEIRASRSS